ncbi:MAG TPA: aminoglycoside phosphotransferase family protein [Acidimicrobiales bacterium]
MTITRAPASSTDAMALLTGTGAGDLIRTVLRPHGADAARWRVTEVASQRRGIRVRYDVEVVWPDGRRSHEMLAAATGTIPEGAAVLEDGPDRIAVWGHPFDPELPALPAASSPEAVACLLEELGISKGPVELRHRAYRPTRRAVIEAIGPRGRLFLKVVRPDRVESIHRIHRVLVEHDVPVAPSLGWTPDGLLVVQALPGSTMREHLLGDRPGLPTGQTVVELLGRFPDELLQLPAAPTWLDRVGHYAGVTARALPDQRGRLESLVAEITDQAQVGPMVPVHGDLYDSQLLVGAGRITGLLDVDTMRPGDRTEDLACLLGHLSVLAALHPHRGAAIRALGARYLEHFDGVVPPADLRWRTAAVVVSLTTGPHRVQQANWERATRSLVELARRWAQSAART